MVANTNLPKKLPTAQEVMEKLALAEAEKASVEARKHAAAEAEKKALIDKITKPSGVSDEEALRRVAIIIDRAVANGLTEVQVYRFPNTLCTDNGRAINQQEAGWETTQPASPRKCTSSGLGSSAHLATSLKRRSSTFRVACPEMSASP